MGWKDLYRLQILTTVVICSILVIYLRAEFTLYSVPFYTPRRTQEKEKNGIPLILHEYWHSRRMPYHMSKTVEKTIAMNPDFDVYVYSEKEAIEFLQNHFEPEVLSAYYGLKPTAYRCDLFRYCVLYIKGGIYLDTKMETLTPLNELIRDSEPIFLRTDVKWCGDGRGVQNGLIITPPKAELMRAFIDEILKAYAEKSHKENDLDITGPCMIGRILNTANMADKRDNARCVSSEEAGDFVFTCDGTAVARSYKEYRAEQATSQKEPSYKELWKKKDVYW